MALSTSLSLAGGCSITVIFPIVSECRTGFIIYPSSASTVRTGRNNHSCFCTSRGFLLTLFIRENGEIMLFGFSTDRTQTNRGICPCFLIRPLVAAFYNIIVSIPTDRTGVTGNTIGCTGSFADYLCIPLMFVCLSTSLAGYRSIVIFLPVVS